MCVQFTFYFIHKYKFRFVTQRKKIHGKKEAEQHLS